MQIYTRNIFLSYTDNAQKFAEQTLSIWAQNKFVDVSCIKWDRSFLFN